MRMLALLAAIALTGCPGNDHDGSEHDPHGVAEHDEHDDHDHAEHVHTAPHGGHLVELGDHAGNVELALDATTGELTAWVLGPHAEHAVRIAAPALEVSVRTPDGPVAVTLAAVADPLSGETAGDTATFRGRSAALEGLRTFGGRLGAITARGVEFPAVDFTYDAD